MIPFPDKQYDIIYADPPWHDKGCLMSGSKIKNHYSTMGIKEICKMPVQDISEKDCLLFMWTTGVNLIDSINVGEAWGFKYKTIAFNWHKQNPVVACYTMSETELCLLFKRCKIPQPRGKRNIRQFLSVKKGGHSAKPLEVKHRINEMFPTQSKIELFARPLPMQCFFGDDGWDYWGNEV